MDSYTKELVGRSGPDINLWDVQTGGVIKTFNYIAGVTSVSISADNTTIATGSQDKAICLWNVETGDTYGIRLTGSTKFPIVCFSPKDSQLLLSTYNCQNTMWWWGTDGYCIGPPVPSDYVTFSPDGKQFASYYEDTITVQDTDSGNIVTQFHTSKNCVDECCFSPNGKFVACVADYIYLLDITNTHSPNLVKTPSKHWEPYPFQTRFSSAYTLITASEGGIKFWDIHHLLSVPDAPGIESMAAITTPIIAVSIQSKEGLAFSIDKGGVVKTWDISTGHCKETIQTQAKHLQGGDMQLINNKLILVGGTDDTRIWDVGEGVCLTKISTPSRDVRISGDGSKFISLCNDCDDGLWIKAWSIWTGELISRAKLWAPCFFLNPLRMDGSEVSVWFNVYAQAWGFGTQGSDPIQLSVTPSDNPCIYFYDHWNTGAGRRRFNIGIRDRVAKRDFPLPSELESCQGHSHPLAPSTKSELLQQATGYTTPGNTLVGVLIH